MLPVWWSARAVACASLTPVMSVRSLMLADRSERHSVRRVVVYVGDGPLVAVLTGRAAKWGLT